VTVNNVRRIREMDNLKLTLYVLLSSAGFFLINASFNGGVQAIPSGSVLVNLLLLAFLPTLVSNLALVRAIKSIGSTLTSVLGAMEPLTAIVIGVVVFGEMISGTMALGILLIIAAVTIIGALGVVLSPNVVHSALFLVLSFIGVAAIYFYIGAEFLGAVQLMVYSGAVAVLIVMAIMLTRRDPMAPGDHGMIMNQRLASAGAGAGSGLPSAPGDRTRP